ncbi:methyltransferase [Nocardioides sp. LML1-1-1.1]|uniref:methyltransferase n=1 Tax=Nocardioides sp. LML1-1-1.1 TaxID=3135248 RepID=UPI003415E3A9
MDHTSLDLAPRSMTFGPLSIAYDDRVLTPRPWTVLQSEWARELLETAPPGPVLELCSGAGHIGLLAVHDTDRALVCVDVDPIACGYAEANARAAGRAGLVDVRNVAMGELAAGELFPVVVADPPWVLSDQVGCFPADPVRAIDGGADGLALARECVATIDRHLDPRGAALLQLGSLDQARSLRGELPDSLRMSDIRAEAGCGLVLLLQRPEGLS